MKGRDRFSGDEAAAIRTLLFKVRRAEPGPAQKVLRDQLRGLGFYISDFGGSTFTRSDFDDLVLEGRVTIDGGSDVKSPATPRRRSPPEPLIERHSSVEHGGTDEPPDVELTVAIAMNALSRHPVSIPEARNGAVSNRPGLYALYGSAETWSQLGLGSPPDARPLYVGKAEASLVSRDLKTHFATGRTGQSSPRRSFAALLAREGRLQLEPVARRLLNPEPGKWTHFALVAAGDARLTAWMTSSLSIAVWVKAGDTSLTEIEQGVMRAWQPPLNLTGVVTPWTREVRAARSRMADAARAAYEPASRTTDRPRLIEHPL